MATTHHKRVLVTGAAGLVGRAVVPQLLGRGVEVIATDLDTPANRDTLHAVRRAAADPTLLQIEWADLTDRDEIDDLLAQSDPDAVVHLAAVIPPFCYANRRLARAVNVDATRHLVAAAAAQPTPPRFVLASSIAVYGARNPHHHSGLLTAETPLAPTDLYGGHKAEAERAVRDSGLDWLILRLGGVLNAEGSLHVDPALIAFESVLPADGRIHTVAVGDVAIAFANALDAPDTGVVHLIGGDDTHRLRQGEIGSRLAAAMGLVGGFPAGRPGNPDDDRAWFATDWCDTREAQAALAFQTTTFDALVAQTRKNTGRLRHLLRLAAPAAAIFLRIRSPYFRYPGTFADPWEVIAERWGSAAPDPVPTASGEHADTPD